MLNISEKVKEIRVYRNAIIYNEHHERAYLLKKYIEIEFFNGKISKLDTIAGADITKYDYLKIKDKGTLKKVIFHNAIA